MAQTTFLDPVGAHSADMTGGIERCTSKRLCRRGITRELEVEMPLRHAQ